MKRYAIRGIAIWLLVVSGCSRHSVLDRVVIPSVPLKPSEDAEAWFKEVKSRWTIIIGSRGMNAGPGMRPSFSGVQGSPKDSRFPLTVTATLMDSQVIQAGFLYYQQMTQMSREEAEHFQQRYRDRNEIDEYILIEANLRTTAAENYLDFSRYTIFLEDDQGNQHLPAKIVEMPVATNRFEGMVNNPSLRRPFYMNFSDHTKNAFLYFPRYDYYGNPTLPENIKHIRLVFILDVGGHARAEGTWVFRSER